MKIKLKEILDSRKISIYSLSKRIGVSQNNLSKIVKGQTQSIRYDILEKICYVLQISVQDVFELEIPDLSLLKEITKSKITYNPDSYNKLFELFSKDINFTKLTPYEQTNYVTNFIIDYKQKNPSADDLFMINQLYNNTEQYELNPDYIETIKQPDLSNLKPFKNSEEK